MIATGLLLAASTALAATVGTTSTIITDSSSDSFRVTSPWAVAVSTNKDLYFSNFGAPDGVDWIGVQKSGKADFSKFVSESELKDEFKDGHFKQLVANGDTVYAALYNGGPTQKSYILKCTAGTCTALCDIGSKDVTKDRKFMPTAIAYSQTLGRVFFAVADGELKNSFIASVPENGGDYEVYLSQTMGNGCEYPIGLAVDDTNALLFWSNDIGNNKIQQGNLGLTYSSGGTIMKDASRRPNSLAIDVNARFIYFSDQNSASNYIGRVRYGGGGYDAEFETILPNLKTPTGLALSVSDKFLYFAETGSSAVKRVKVDDIGDAAPSAIKNAGSSRALSLAVAAVVALVGAASLL